MLHYYSRLRPLSSNIRYIRNMTTFMLDSKIKTTIPSHLDLTQEQLQQYKPFKTWYNSLKKEADQKKFDLRSINIQSVDWFGSNQNKKLGFIKLETDIIHPNGKKVPGVVLLRGGSVAMLILLKSNETGDLYTILTSQPRVASGDLSVLELPAGMIDDGTFRGAAAREIEEECGFTIPENELTELSGEPVLISPGFTDETMSFYTYTRPMPLSEINELDGKLTGNPNENESITLKIVSFDDTMKYQKDGKLLMALALYKGFQNN